MLELEKKRKGKSFDCGPLRMEEDPHMKEEKSCIYEYLLEEGRLNGSPLIFLCQRSSNVCQVVGERFWRKKSSNSRQELTLARVVERIRVSIA